MQQLSPRFSRPLLLIIIFFTEEDHGAALRLLLLLLLLEKGHHVFSSQIPDMYYWKRIAGPHLCLSSLIQPK